MNSDLSKWNVAKVTSLSYTFGSASKFTGAGLGSWDIAKVTTMSNTFTTATSITSCNKRKIADVWKSNSAFATYNIAWAADACSTPLTDATFKQASWGTLIQKEGVSVYPMRPPHAPSLYAPSRPCTNAANNLL
jgi:hypothetical protein